MSLWTRLFPRFRPQPSNASQATSGGVTITTAQELEEYLRSGQVTASGRPVTPDTAMRVSAVYACVRTLSGPPATLPLDIKRRVDERTREDASETPIAKLFSRRPNRWQTPSQFKRMMGAHQLLRGAGSAMIVWSRGEPQELIPLHPDRLETKQRDDLKLEHIYTRKDGGRVTLQQEEVLQLVNLTLDGVRGVTPITFARESIGLSLAMESHGTALFKNGARASSVLKHPGKLGKEGLEFVRASLDAYREGGEAEGKALILEEGMDVSPLAMTSEDAQWIDSRKFSRSDIAMFFGVPPHMIGDTEKSTSWGTGIVEQANGFVAYVLEDYLTMWEEAIWRDLIRDPASKLYARFNRSALVKGDIKARWDAYAVGRRIKVLSANDVRSLEDLNPIAGGDVYENPDIDVTKKKEPSNEPAPAA